MAKFKEYCNRGHLMAETRRTNKSKSYCAECAKITSRAWYNSNIEHRSVTQREWAIANAEKLKEYRAKWYIENREKKKLSTMRHLLRHNYGLTLEKYGQMSNSQDGKCAICKKPPRGRRLDVDHDHVDGHVRGLLCERCNKGLGCFGDSPAILKLALEYLKKHSQLQLVMSRAGNELEKFRAGA